MNASRVHLALPLILVALLTGCAAATTPAATPPPPQASTVASGEDAAWITTLPLSFPLWTGLAPTDVEGHTQLTRRPRYAPFRACGTAYWPVGQPASRGTVDGGSLDWTYGRDLALYADAEAAAVAMTALREAVACGTERDVDVTLRYRPYAFETGDDSFAFETLRRGPDVYTAAQDLTEVVRVGNAVLLLTEWVDHSVVDVPRRVVRDGHEDTDPVVAALAPFADPGGTLPEPDALLPALDLAHGLGRGHRGPGPRVPGVEVLSGCGGLWLTHPIVARSAAADADETDVRLAVRYPSREKAQAQLDDLSEHAATCVDEPVEGGTITGGLLRTWSAHDLAWGTWMRGTSGYDAGTLLHARRVGATLVITYARGSWSRADLVAELPERRELMRAILG